MPVFTKPRSETVRVHDLTVVARTNQGRIRPDDVLRVEFRPAVRPDDGSKTGNKRLVGFVSGEVWEQWKKQRV